MFSEISTAPASNHQVRAGLEALLEAYRTKAQQANETVSGRGGPYWARGGKHSGRLTDWGLNRNRDLAQRTHMVQFQAPVICPGCHKSCTSVLVEFVNLQLFYRCDRCRTVLPPASLHGTPSTSSGQAATQPVTVDPAAAIAEALHTPAPQAAPLVHTGKPTPRDPNQAMLEREAERPVRRVVRSPRVEP